MLCQQWLYEPSLSQPPASLLEQEFEPSTTEYQLSSPMQQYHLAHYEFATLHFLRSGKLRYRNKGGIIREGRWQLSNDYQSVLLQIDGKSIRYRIISLTPEQLAIEGQDDSRWVFTSIR